MIIAACIPTLRPIFRRGPYRRRVKLGAGTAQRNVQGTRIGTTGDRNDVEVDSMENQILPSNAIRMTSDLLVTHEERKHGAD